MKVCDLSNELIALVLAILGLCEIPDEPATYFPLAMWVLTAG
jgi:hypothetical protein